MARKASEQKLEREGFTFHGYEYDYDAQREQKNIMQRGFEAKLLRERTDTPGLKMFSIWKREA